MKLRSKVTLLLTGLMILLVWFGALLQFRLFQDRLKETVAEQQRSLVSQTVEGLEQRMALNQSALVAVAVGVNGDLLRNPEALRMVLNGKGVLLNLFDALMVVGRDGQIIADWPQLPSRQEDSRSALPAWQQVMESGKPAISPPLLSNLSDRPFILISVPVFDSRGAVVATLSGSIDLLKNNFISSLGERKVGKSGSLLLTTRERTVSAGPNPARLLRPADDASGVPPFEPSLVGMPKTFESRGSAAAPAMLMSFRALRSTGWLVGVLQPVDDALAPLIYMRWLMLALGLLTSTLVAGVAWWSTRWFLRPLTQLNQEIQTMRLDPEHKATPVTERGDELGILARNFQMLLVELGEARTAAGQQAVELESILNATPVGVMVVVNRYVLRANPAASKILGLEHDQLVGHSSRQFYLDDHDFEEFGRRIMASVINGGTASFERRFRLGDGSLRWTVFRARMIDVTAPEKGMVTILEDVQARRTQEETIRENELRYRQMFNNNTSIKILIDPQSGEIIDVNQAACDFYGYALADLLRKKISDINILSPDEVQREMQAATSEGRRYFNFRHRLASGEVRHVEVHSAPIAVKGRNLLYSIVHDTTARRRAEEALRLTSQVFEEAHEGIAITDRRNRIVTINRAFTKITGYQAEEVVGRDPKILRSGRQEPAYYAQMWQELSARGIWEGEMWNRRKNGEEFPLWLSISTVHGEDGAVSNYVAVFSDLSERKAREEQIRVLAEYDSLTGLANRALFNDRLVQSLALAGRREGAHLAVLFIDLDRFKNINDSLGHQVGDQLLQIAAGRIQACVRASDTVSRPGGDEFLLLFPEIGDADDVARVAEKLLAALAEPCQLGGQELRITASVGIAIYPEDGREASTLLQNADAAMYHSKEAGRNRYHFFTRDMNERISSLLALENSMRRALQREEFMLHYQPQVNIGEHRLVGVEALIRWQHPDLGLMPPGRFIPVAEDSGLIVPLGQWVLIEACRQARRWLDEGLPPLRMAVNISALQFAHPQFEQMVLTALKETGLDPALLELELTESIMMQDVEHSIAVLRSLKALGIQLSIDDFGTGYSSLAYLKRFPIDRLKIDQAFVRDITIDPDDAAITSTIISMAKTLGLKVIAEGVETVEQQAFLCAEGCDELQGYFIARPMAADLLVSFSRQWAGLPAATILA
jgi:diguanylate cyclase (GGDEF)-like protein/PAS domain S-box-containing protein